MNKPKQFPLRYQLRSAWPYLLVLALWLCLVGLVVYTVVHFIAKFW